MNNHFNKFTLLMWKNWIQLRRTPLSTAFEIIYPSLVCLVFLVFALRNQVVVTKQDAVAFEPITLMSYSNELCKNDTDFRFQLAYSPESALIDKVVKRIQEKCGPFKLYSFPNSQALTKAIDSYNSTFHAAIQFDNTLSNVINKTDIPKNLNVVLRLSSEYLKSSQKREWYTSLLYPAFQVVGPRNWHTNDPPPEYIHRGFLNFQQLITFALINNEDTIKSEAQIKVNRYPYPSWLDDQFYVPTSQLMISMLLLLSFVQNFSNTIKSITLEKEQQLKESMKIMGLPGWLHWLAWFLRSFVLLLIAIIIMVSVLKYNFRIRPVFSHSDGTLVFVFLLIFACSNITFSFFISVFFSKANTATALGSVMFFVTYMPYVIEIERYDSLSLSTILSLCLLGNSAFSFGVTLIIKWEAIEEGIQWSNVWHTVSPDDQLTFGAVILMLVLDTLLYFIVTLYIEAVFPGDFGVPQPWYFPVSRAYWCNEPGTLDYDPPTQNKGGNYEAFTENLPKGIELKNLSKTFGSHKAVENLNLDMYQGHITVLLGHNGAGKTTTMSMITGMFPPTKGTAIVSGYDVRTNIGRVRDSMGLCLQHNVLFDDLTVREHLYFFGKLKGLSDDEIQGEIDNYLNLLELEDKRNAASKTLSGGMKRKLSVAMALCGKSKVVMLDEPTSGMDPSARRTVWNLLQKQKEGRTILLTTHFMDEADLLGDRIAIMTAGELQCCGTSFFLKRKYGAGYYLIMDVSPQCIPENVSKLLRKHIPNVEVFSHVGSELTYRLSRDDSPKFEGLLYDLESSIANLNVRSYGVSLTTLEEVFMKVGADHIDEKPGKNGYQLTIDKTSKINAQDNLKGCPLLCDQFIAMALKKFFSMLRTWPLFILHVLLLIALTLSIFLNANAAKMQLSTFPSLALQLDPYHNPVTLVSGSETNSLYQKYINSSLLKGSVKKVDNIATEIITRTIKSPSTVKNRYIAGASFSDNELTVWFNGEPYHSSPLALGLALNALYKNSLGDDKTITFINHPLPLSIETHMHETRLNIMGLQLAFMLGGYGMAFVASFYVLFPIKERMSKSKHLQFVSGMNAFVFWGTSFLWDFVSYLIMVIVIIIAIAACQQNGFKTADELGRFTLVFIYFGFFALPFVYLMSFLFSVPSTGYSVVMTVGMITGAAGFCIIIIMENSLNLLYITKPLNLALLFIPFYSVCKAMYDLNSIYTLKDQCSKYGSIEFACLQNKLCCDINDYFAMTTPGIGRNILIAFMMSVLLLAILVFNEFGFISYVKNVICHYKKPPDYSTTLEEDVENENAKIRDTDETILRNEYILLLKDVTKFYKKILAVNRICLGVKPYECFGLLGVNGAGKTTTFKMMTGDEQISYGNAWVLGRSIKSQQKEVQKLIGYCPQFDALLDDLTVKETLKIFALIRGVPRDKCNALVVELAQEFDFSKHIDKQIKQLSGGNKRKLSTALAFVGDPPVIYLDEPTTGMDPATKRYLWTALAKLRDSGKCIILTSHTMEECEALCTRIAIMVNGTFQCLGSAQRLKNKFAKGYSLMIKINRRGDNSKLEEHIKAIDRFVQMNFPGAQLKEKFQELLTYQSSNSSIPWSKMFGILERNKKQLNIEDYSLGQCSLEQVFLSFANQQIT